jgi:hypothetical protein
MKKKYPSKKWLSKSLIRVLIISLVFILPISLIGQQSYTFTNCGAVGASGPTQTQVNSTYTTGNSLNGLVTVIGSGIQQFTVPTTGLYKIEARGASGFPFGTGGRGAIMYGEFNLTAGNVLKIVVAQAGSISTTGGNLQFGGGGGSFVSLLSNTPLIIAGGGGGSHATSYTTSGADGTVSANGNSGSGSTSGGGGTGGSGGLASSSANGGAGFFGDGGGTTGVALSFTNGALGGNVGGLAYTNGAIGGFGGGGATQSWNNNRGGGGGGYSGGGGGQLGQPACWGGGGGSFNSGTNQLNQSGANTFSNGLVIITEACNISLTASGANSVNPSICSGQSLTLTTNGVGNYSWSTGNTTSNSITISPTITTVYSLSATSPSACTAVRSITVLVSNGQPTISVVSSTNNICLGRTVTLTANGAITYTWSGGVTNGASFAPTSTSSYTVSGQNACGTSSAITSVTVAPLSVSAITSNSVVCSGQTTTLIASSAVNGYTWQPFGFIGGTVIVGPNVSTIYTVTASDGTCAGITTVAVNAIPIPTLNTVASSTNFCAGNSATITASGAIGYTWQPGNVTGSSLVVSPLIPTLYTLTGIASNNCTTSINQIVVVNPSPTITLSSSDPIICSGGSATLFVNGASSYTWNVSSNASSLAVTPSQSTTYSVIAEDASNNCKTTGTISVNVFSPTLSIAGNTAVCLGSPASLQASGGNNYQWSNGIPGANNTITPTSNTIVSVTALTSSGSINCPSSASIQITVLANPTINVVVSNTSICRGENASISASGGQTYTWSTGATGPSVTITSSLVTTLNYSVIGSNNLNCTASNSVLVRINSCVGLLEKNNDESILMVYPNPNNGSFNINYSKNLTLSIFNQLGQLILMEELDESNNYTIQVNGLKQGIYFVSGIDVNNRLIKKIVVE